MKFKSNKAFSLIEMMVVLTVVAILLAFAAPNLFSLISASTLTGEGTVIQNQLTLAQQTAISKSADVEVRFFKFADESSAQLEEAYRAFQLYQYQPDGRMVPISEFFRIRPPVAIHNELSSLFKESNVVRISEEDRRLGFVSPRFESGDTENPVPIRRSGTEVAPYVAFRFRPDGSTDLPYRAFTDTTSDTWHLTLVQGEGALQNTTPDNYVCLQINPYNGKIDVFRP